jgi:hypothetical protein
MFVLSIKKRKKEDRLENNLKRGNVIAQIMIKFHFFMNDVSSLSR